jgi:hypothetical protein
MLLKNMYRENTDYDCEVGFHRTIQKNYMQLHIVMLNQTKVYVNAYIIFIFNDIIFNNI